MYESKAHFANLYQNIPSTFSFSDRLNLEEQTFNEWQNQFRLALHDLLGLNNMLVDLASYQPYAEKRSAEELSDHIREFWYLWVEPTVPLPFYLLRPKQVADGLPLVITPHGHNHPHLYVGIARNDGEKLEIQEGQRDIACQAVRQGYLVIAPTTRGFGETRTKIDKDNNKVHSCRTELMHDLLVGRTPIGVRVWDMSRLIDWAIDTQNIDEHKIAMTGNSGGGTITLHSAAIDTRISVAVPSCYFCTYVDSIGTIAHCDCNYLPGILRLGEMYDVAGLIAPRPISVIAGRDDKIFPIDYVRFAFDKLQAIYQAAGVADRCQLYVGQGGHRYYSDGAWDFIRYHFDQAK